VASFFRLLRFVSGFISVGVEFVFYFIRGQTDVCLDGVDRFFGLRLCFIPLVFDFLCLITYRIGDLFAQFLTRPGGE